MKAKTILPMLVFALGAWLTGTPALAQDVTFDRVRMALDRTDARIEMTTSAFAGSNNPEAKMELDAAVLLQSQAREALSRAMPATGDERLRRLRRAIDLTDRAREHADRAVSMIQGLPDPGRVTPQLERTRELIARAQDRIAECNNPRAPAVLRLAGDMQASAENAAADGHYLVALRLTMGARDRAMRAARLCNQEERLDEASDRALRRTDEVIARAKDELGPEVSESARDLIARADRIQMQAWAEFRARHLEPSLRLTLTARNLVQRALRLERQS
jgi:hypothetical protein